MSRESRKEGSDGRGTAVERADELALLERSGHYRGEARELTVKEGLYRHSSAEKACCPSVRKHQGITQVRTGRCTKYIYSNLNCLRSASVQLNIGNGCASVLNTHLSKGYTSLSEHRR